MGDEDEEASAEGGMNVTKYPVMPSLVSLMQMRNRLHLAFLGRKLMKWTAMATGKELRRLSQEIAAFYTAYREEVRDAYLSLARIRYFIDHMNYIVLESVPPYAIITVKSSSRSVSGVKVRNIHLLEIGTNGYQYLGLARGGESVRAAREAWLALIKKMVWICQLRSTFNLIDVAHKNATNVYTKLTTEIIPKLISSINEATAQQKKKRREALLKKTDKKIIKKAIDKLTKKLILESSGGFDGVIKKEETIVSNEKPDIEKSGMTLQKHIEVLPHKYQLLAVYRAVLERTLVNNNRQRPIKEDKNHKTNSEQRYVTTQESIKALPQKCEPLVPHKGLLRKTVADNKTQVLIKNDELNPKLEQNMTSQKSIDVNKQKHFAQVLCRALLRKTTVDKNKQPIKNDEATTKSEQRDITLQEAIKVNPQKHLAQALCRALQPKTLGNKTQVPIKEDKNDELITDLEQGDITSQESVKVPSHKYNTLAQNRTLSHKTLADIKKTQVLIKNYKNDEYNLKLEKNYTTSQESIEINPQKHLAHALCRALRPKTLGNKMQVPIKEDKNDEPSPNSEENDTPSQESIKESPQKYHPLILYRALLRKALSDNKKKLPIEKDRYGKPETYLGKGASQEPFKPHPQKYDSFAVYKAFVHNNSIENKIQFPQKKYENTKPTIDSSSKIKQKLVKERKDLIKKVLPVDDELGRVFQAKYHKHVLDKDFVPHWKVKYPFRKQKHKVFVMDHQSASIGNQQPQQSRNPLKKSNLPNKRQRSSHLYETSLKLYSATSQNQGSASKTKKKSKKHQRLQNKNTVVISDSTSVPSQQSLLDVKLIYKDKNELAKIIRYSNKTQVSETSSSFKISCTSRASQTDPTDRMSSKRRHGVCRFRHISPTTSREQELIVIKHPEDSDCGDDFIPPVPHKNYITNCNILKIEELLEDETDEDIIEKPTQNLQITGESFETGEWFETATIKSKSDSLLVLPKIHSKKSSSNSELYSKCKLPIKENSESHIKLSNYSRATNEDISTRDVTRRASKRIKSGRNKSTSSGVVAALDKTRYLDRFNSSDDFDESFQRFLEIKESLQKQKSENRRVYAVKEDSDISGSQCKRRRDRKNRK